MLLLYSLPLFLLFSFAGASAVKEPLKILESAIVEYMSSPVQVRNGMICVDNPLASGTHQALSDLLVKCPYQNGYEQSSMVDFLVHLGVAKPESDQKIVSSVRASFLGILEYCSIKLEPKLKNARSWKVLLRYVGRVFKEHAPSGTSYELAFEYEKYNFLIFLLMRWKLEFGRLKQLELKSVSTSKEAKRLFQALDENDSTTTVVAPATVSNSNSSAIGMTMVAAPVKAKKVLKGAIELYALSPLQDCNGTITIHDPPASDTHEALIKLLAKYPTENGWHERFMVDVLVELGFPRPGHHQSHFLVAQVKTSLINILQSCKVKVNAETKIAKSWPLPLKKVGEVFEKYAPSGTTTELVTNYDKYNFLVFLLVHWKLNHDGALPDYSSFVKRKKSLGISKSVGTGEAGATKLPKGKNSEDSAITDDELDTMNELPSNNNMSYQPNANTLVGLWGTEGKNIVNGLASISNSSQLNGNPWKDQQNPYQKIRNPPPVTFINSTATPTGERSSSQYRIPPVKLINSTSKSSGEHSQAVIYPKEPQRAQLAGVDVTGLKEAKRNLPNTNEDLPNKRQRVGEYEYALAPATGNSSNLDVTGIIAPAESLQPLDVLKRAVELFSLFPLRTVHGSAFIDNPSVSNTHNALSMLLVKYPRGNSIEMGSFDDFLVDLGFPRPPYVNAIILSVNSSFLDILDKCQEKVDVEFRDASSWEILKKVGDVFKAYAPPWTTTKLKTEDDQYNFLIFLLTHWKLMYGALPDFNRGASRNPGVSTYLPMGKKFKEADIITSTNFPYGYTSERPLMQQSYATPNTTFSANMANHGASIYSQPFINTVGISERQNYNPYLPVTNLSTNLTNSSVLGSYGGSTINGAPILSNTYPLSVQQYSITYPSAMTITSTDGGHSNPNNNTGLLVENAQKPIAPANVNQSQQLEEPATDIEGIQNPSSSCQGDSYIDYSNFLEYPEHWF